MDLARSSDIDEAEYERFLDRFASRPGAALAYHYPFHLRFLAGTAYPTGRVRFVTARDARGALVGVIPAVHVRTSAVNLWLSLAYFGPNAGALVGDADAARSASLVGALTATARLDAQDLDCGSMTLYTPLNAVPDGYRTGLDGVDFDTGRIAQWLRLPADPDASPWPRKVRYDIRRAASLGVTVRAVADQDELDRVWEIYERNCQDVGIPVKPREHVRALYHTAGDHGLFLLAEHGGGIVAGLIGLLGGGVLSYYLPCTRLESRPLQPGLLLLDRAVAIARGRGCRLLNFEASPSVESPVYRFKERCGGAPVPYRVLVKLLRRDVLDEYRALTPAGLGREAPHAFVVPFEALSGAPRESM